MAENETERKDGAAAGAKDGAKEQGAAGTEKAAASGGTRPAPRRLLAAALLLGMVAGSASAAVVVASLVLRAGAAPPAGPGNAGTAAPAAASGSDGKAAKSCEFTLDTPVIVNVYQTQERRYLSVKPVFVLDGTPALEKVKASQSQLQDLLIGILKGKTLDQLDDPDAVDVIGREVQETANLKLNLDRAVTRVYFTQFVVQ